jgi:RHS repeat-associated protein
VKSHAKGTTFTALDQQRTQNQTNEITGLASTTGPQWLTPEHDHNGNMTLMPRPDDLDEGYRAVYDAWNRLVKLETDEETPVLVAAYNYDGLNRRIRKTTSDGSRDYYYSDSWQVIEAGVETEDIDEQYVWGIRYIDDLVLRDRSTGTGLGDERLYALQDANWSVVALSDTSGEIVERFAYEPYGKLSQLNPNFTPYSGTEYDWEYTYTGRQLDLESRLYQYRMRYYHAELGRFVTRDPKGHAAGVNYYRYVQNRPTTFTDPSGLTPIVIGPGPLPGGIPGWPPGHFEGAIPRWIPAEDPPDAMVPSASPSAREQSVRALFGLDLHNVVPVFKPETTVTQKATPVDACGGFVWGVKWKIPKKFFTSSGWIIQRVENKTEVTDCEGKPVKPGVGEGPLDSSFVEAWEFTEDGKVWAGLASNNIPHNSSVPTLVE